MKIEWKGGECPVSGDTRVMAYFRDGFITDNIEAGEFRWNHTGDRSDIIAYEVIEEEPKQITEKTLRDEFAKAWLENFPRDGGNIDDIAEECYEIADAMMKARAK